MNRRGVGIAAIQKSRLAKERYQEKRNQIEQNLLEELTKQMGLFKDNLEAFAKKHQKTIKKDPEFRQHFMQMCAQIGVDPMASSKGFWSSLGLGSFYTTLALQAVEVVLAVEKSHGGIMTLGELHQRLNKSRGKQSNEISHEDLIRAIKSLEVLGKSCGIVHSQDINQTIIFCVPEELSLDNTTVMRLASENKTPSVTALQLQDSLGWKPERVKTVLEQLTREKLVWIDDFKGMRSYWFPGMFLIDEYDA